MINRTAITQWNKIVPWNDNAQVEQDLIISRALVAIFSDKFLLLHSLRSEEEQHFINYICRHSLDIVKILI